MPVKVVSTLADYLEVVGTYTKELRHEDPWFRGTKLSKSHKLVPGLYRREAKPSSDLNLRHFFRLRAYPFLTPTVRESDWHEYVAMQHYGLPTRLLDWSRSPLIALHFAVEKGNCPVDDNECPKKYREEHAAVWILNPVLLNAHFRNTEQGKIFGHYDPEAQAYLPSLRPGETSVPSNPLALHATACEPRIGAQHGAFTIHGTDKTALEDFDNSAYYLTKIELERAATPSLRSELRSLGFGEATVFPELQGICTEISNWYFER